MTKSNRLSPRLLIGASAAAATFVLYSFAPAPAGATERAELVALCERWLEDYSNGNFDAVEATFAPGAVVAYDIVAADRQFIQSAETFMERQRRTLSNRSDFREWISDEPTVLIDSKIATVWAPYEIEAGEQRATGIDAWHFLKIEGEWKVVCLTFSNRPAEGQP